MNDITQQTNEDQITYWNSDAASRWIRFQDEIDKLFQAINERLLTKAQPEMGECVLDVGCGTGSTSIAFANEVRPTGQVVGLDISNILLAEAKKRATISDTTSMSFHLADAQSHSLGHDLFDLIISRFGVMFFDNPIAAFSNLQTMLHPDGRIIFVSWAAMIGNPWFDIPRKAAIARLGKPQPTPPRAPGPLAFAEHDYVRDILQQAGFSKCQSQEEEVLLTHPGGVEAAARLASNLGPAARIVREYNGGPEDVEIITTAVHDAFKAFETSAGVTIPARLNFFQARKD